MLIFHNYTHIIIFSNSDVNTITNNIISLQETVYSVPTKHADINVVPQYYNITDNEINTGTSQANISPYIPLSECTTT